MNTEYVIEGKNIKKTFRRKKGNNGFCLDIEEVKIPKGFATALIGENGAGKTTLLNIMTGIRMDYKGEFTYFGETTDIDTKGIKTRIGYTSPSNFFLPNWTIKQVEEITGLLYDNFDKNKFYEYTKALNIPTSFVKNVKALSDGNKMKLMIATAIARDTDLLIMDEPASPLDPLMRDKLCEIIRNYIAKGEGEKSVFFSTHNIADMESVTDYAIIMDNGSILENGFVEELKEKYVYIKGESEDYEIARKMLIGGSQSRYGFEGLILSENLNKLAGKNVAVETPNLSQICVGLMKEHTKLGEIL